MAGYGPTLKGFATGGKGGEDGNKEVRFRICIHRCIYIYLYICGVVWLVMVRNGMASPRGARAVRRVNVSIYVYIVIYIYIYIHRERGRGGGERERERVVWVFLGGG